MSRVILYVDANSFYATVECLYRPEVQGRPLSVCGDPEKRHGIEDIVEYVSSEDDQLL